MADVLPRIPLMVEHGQMYVYAKPKLTITVFLILVSFPLNICISLHVMEMLFGTYNKHNTNYNLIELYQCWTISLPWQNKEPMDSKGVSSWYIEYN